MTFSVKPQKNTLFPKSNMTLLDLNAFYGHFRKLENMTKEWTWHNNYSPIISPLTFRVKRADKKLEWNKFIADGKMKTHNLTQMYPNLGIGARDWPAIGEKNPNLAVPKWPWRQSLRELGWYQQFCLGLIYWCEINSSENYANNIDINPGLRSERLLPQNTSDVYFERNEWHCGIEAKSISRPKQATPL